MKKAAIWGAGKIGKSVFAPLCEKYNMSVEVYIDSAVTKQGEYLCGVKIVSPEALKKMDIDLLFIAVYDYEQIKDIKDAAIKLGILEDKIVELATDFSYLDVVITRRGEWLSNCAKWINNEGIRGSIAECGVFRGDFAKYMNFFFPERKLYLFDTFEGFDEGDMKKESSVNKYFENSIFNSDSIFGNTNIDFVMAKMSNPEMVEIRKGHFPETAKDIIDTFAFVNLDMDLYEPMLNGLRYFWDRLEIGGYILLHDYFCSVLPGVRKAVEDFEKEIRQIVPKVPIGDGQSIVLMKM